MLVDCTVRVQPVCFIRCIFRDSVILFTIITIHPRSTSPRLVFNRRWKSRRKRQSGSNAEGLAVSMWPDSAALGITARQSSRIVVNLLACTTHWLRTWYSTVECIISLRRYDSITRYILVFKSWTRCYRLRSLLRTNQSSLGRLLFCLPI